MWISYADFQDSMYRRQFQLLYFRQDLLSMLPIKSKDRHLRWKGEEDGNPGLVPGIQSVSQLVLGVE